MKNNSNSNIFKNEKLTVSDINSIITLSQDPDIYKRIIFSVAPNIFGHDQLKELLLLIVHSTDKHKSKELREDTINILIICDYETKHELISLINIVSPNYNINTKCINYQLNNNLVCIEYSESICDDKLHKLLLDNKDIIMLCTPKNVKFDYYKSRNKQLDLSSEIISDFDLIYLIDKEKGQKDYELTIDNLRKYGNYRKDFVIEPDLLKKYLSYIHENSNPYLDDETLYFSINAYKYTNICDYNNNRRVFRPMKDFKFIMRLAKTCAKIKLKTNVTNEDVSNALNLTYSGIQNRAFDPLSLTLNNNIKSSHNISWEIIKEIELLEIEFSEGVPLNYLYYNIGEKYGIGENIIDQILTNLSVKGLIYQTESNYIHTI